MMGRFLSAALVIATALPCFGFVLPPEKEATPPTFKWDDYRISQDEEGIYRTNDGKTFPMGVFADPYGNVSEENMAIARPLGALVNFCARLDEALQGADEAIRLLQTNVEGIRRRLGALTGSGCDSKCGCIETAVRNAKKHTYQLYDELSRGIEEEREARISEDASKASITELAEERSARESKDQELYNAMLAYHNGEATENISNILAKVAFTGSYNDLIDKPGIGGAFVNDVDVNIDEGDGQTTVVFNFADVAGNTNGIPEPQTLQIPKCGWNEERIRGIETTLDEHGGRISGLEEKAHDPCNCGGGGGDGDNYYYGGCNCDLSNYVTFDDLENGEGGCDCDMAGIESRLSSLESQVSTLRTELIRLLNYVGYQDHRNGPGR